MINKLSIIFKDEKLTNDEKVIDFTRDDFNYLINRISEYSGNLKDLNDIVLNKIPALHKVFLRGNLD